VINRPLLVSRLLIGLLAIALGLWHPFPTSPGSALQAALISFGGVTLAYQMVDLYWAHLVKVGGGSDGPTDMPVIWGGFAGLLVTTAGLVIGLMQAFGPGSLPPTLKVATLSLAATFISGMLLSNLLASGNQKGTGARLFIAVVFNYTVMFLKRSVLAGKK